MSIRCGNCQDRHPTVNDVRDCYAGQVEWDEERRAEGVSLAYAENAPLRRDDNYDRPDW